MIEAVMAIAALLCAGFVGYLVGRRHGRRGR